MCVCLGPSLPLSPAVHGAPHAFHHPLSSRRRSKFCNMCLVCFCLSNGNSSLCSAATGWHFRLTPWTSNLDIWHDSGCFRRGGTWHSSMAAFYSYGWKPFLAWHSNFHVNIYILGMACGGMHLCILLQNFLSKTFGFFSFIHLHFYAFSFPFLLSM